MFEVGDKVLIVGPSSESSRSVKAIGYVWGSMDKHIGLETTIKEEAPTIPYRDEGVDSVIRIYKLDGVDWVWAEDWLEPVPDPDETLSPPAKESDILALLQG